MEILGAILCRGFLHIGKYIVNAYTKRRAGQISCSEMYAEYTNYSENM